MDAGRKDAGAGRRLKATVATVASSCLWFRRWMPRVWPPRSSAVTGRLHPDPHILLPIPACDKFWFLNARLRNVLLLTLTQATSSTAVTLVAAVGALAGYALASNKALATLPSTMSVIGTALSRSCW